MLDITPPNQTTNDLKSCCAALYESDWARLILGDSFHPGGLALTRRLGELLALQPEQRVLDVASGQGMSAFFIAETFGCRVVGVDYGTEAVEQAQAEAEAKGLSHRVEFVQGDAEALRFDAASFDTIICECAFCTFPDKAAAAREFARVLRPGGRVGLSDLTRTGELPPELETLLAWIACIADARPVGEYVAYFEAAGLAIEQTEAHNYALAEMIRSAQGKLLGLEVMLKLGQLRLPAGIDFEQAKAIAKAAGQAVREGQLGYGLLVGQKL